MSYTLTSACRVLSSLARTLSTGVPFTLSRHRAGAHGAACGSLLGALSDEGERRHCLGFRSHGGFGFYVFSGEASPGAQPTQEPHWVEWVEWVCHLT